MPILALTLEYKPLRDWVSANLEMGNSGIPVGSK